MSILLQLLMLEDIYENEELKMTLRETILIQLKI